MTALFIFIGIVGLITLFAALINGTCNGGGGAGI
jgi:hypothetical protein